MKFVKPRLPYTPDSLSPYISVETVEFHYGKHESAYIDKLNALVEGTDFENVPLEEIVAKSDGAIFNNASQAWNHIFYFFQFAPRGLKEPSGMLRDALERDFGSYEDFKKKFEDAGAGLFGSGWVWLSADNEGKLFISQASNAGNPITDGLNPIMVADVWEHAYYLDYQNRRPAYLEAFWQIVDWSIIERRYSEILED